MNGLGERALEAAGTIPLDRMPIPRASGTSCHSALPVQRNQCRTREGWSQCFTGPVRGADEHGPFCLKETLGPPQNTSTCL